MRTATICFTLCLLTACATKPAPADDPVAQLEALVRARPDDASLRYVLAILEERGGRPARALARLRELPGLAWDYALDDSDFPRTRALAGYAEVKAELARREPRVVRGEVVRVLAERDIRPEGIAWDPEARAFYLGHAPGRGVMMVPLAGPVRPLAVPGPGDMFAPLGMKVDSTTRTLWVASVAFPLMGGFTEADAGRPRPGATDLRSGAARLSLSLGDAKTPSLLNDLALLPGGRVVVTDSQSGALYAADLEASALRVLAPPGSFESPNGIAADDAGATVYVADLFGISAVDPATGAVRRLQAAPGTTLGGVDGLSFASGRLVGIQNLFGAPRIWSVEPASAGTGAPTILSSGDPRLVGPTTGAIVEGALWLIANPQLRAAAGDEPEDLQLLRIPL